MVLEHQAIGEFRQSIQLQGCLYASNVYMQEVQWSCCPNWVKRHFGQIALRLQTMCTGINGLLHLIGHAWPTKVLLQQGQSVVMSLMTCIHMAPFQGGNMMGLRTTKSRRSSVSPFGVEHKYKVPWWIVKFFQFCKISWPSSLEVCSARSAFKSVFFCAFSQSNTALNIRSSFWASAQSVTCICTSTQPVVTHTSCSSWSSPLTVEGSWASSQCMVSNVTPLRIDLTVSGSSWVVTQCSVSATVLSHPFWYSNLKLNCMRALTHGWLITSRLGVVIMLSVSPRKVDRVGTPLSVQSLPTSMLGIWT